MTASFSAADTLVGAVAEPFGDSAVGVVRRGADLVVVGEVGYGEGVAVQLDRRAGERERPRTCGHGGGPDMERAPGGALEVVGRRARA